MHTVKVVGESGSWILKDMHTVKVVGVTSNNCKVHLLIRTLSRWHGAMLGGCQMLLQYNINSEIEDPEGWRSKLPKPGLLKRLPSTLMMIQLWLEEFDRTHLSSILVGGALEKQELRVTDRLQVSIVTISGDQNIRTRVLVSPRQPHLDSKYEPFYEPWESIWTREKLIRVESQGMPEMRPCSF